MNIKRTLFTSLLTILLCISVIAGGTFALFSDTETNDIVVTSGKVDITATLSDPVMSSNALGTGSIVNNTINLSHLMPGDSATTTLTITNVGTVAAKYRVSIIVNNADGLGAAMEVTVGSTKTLGLSAYTSAWASLDANATPVEQTLVFELPSSTGNAFQEKGVSYRVVVEAVQGNATVSGDETRTAYDTVAYASSTVSSGAATITANAAPVATETNNSTTVAFTGLTGVNDGDSVTLNVSTSDVAESTNSFTAMTGTDGPAVAKIDLTLSGATTTFTSAEVTTYISAGLPFPIVIKYGDETWSTETGDKDAVHGITYNAVTGALTFKTTHFSEYVVYSNISTYEAYDSTADKMYATLEDAIVAVNANNGNATIKVLKDIDFSVAPYDAYKWAGSTYNPLTITASNVTIDLGGHTLFNMGNTALVFGHILAADGRISNATIQNGTLNAGQIDGVTNSYVLGIAGVDGATIKNVTTNGGINVYTASDNVVIDHCTVNGTKYYAVCSQTGSEVTIQNTTCTKNTDFTVATKAMFWVDKTGTDNDCITGNNPTGAYDASTITLLSGTFTVDTANGGVFYLTAGLKPSVKGGTFNVNPAEYLATGYTATGSDGTWTVTAIAN